MKKNKNKMKREIDYITPLWHPPEVSCPPELLSEHPLSSACNEETLVWSLGQEDPRE